MKFLFILLVLLCSYSYFIYPLLLKLMPVRRVDVAGSAEIEPCKVSIIITVFNEEKRIREKLENTLKIDYPAEYLDIIVASDFSTDSTDSIVESYAESNVRLVRADERKGKEYAQLCAIRQSQGDILVFSDVATQIPPDALRFLVSKFSDQQVGAVSSEDRFVSRDGQIAGEGAYVKYEMWLRRLESDRAGLVGLSGSFFSARKEICSDWDIYSPSDFNTALNCAKQGKVAISCSDVVGIYSDVQDSKLEYGRKVRTVIRGMTAIIRHPEVLNPFRMGMFAFQVWSHKIMRWAVPWFMLLLFLATLSLLGTSPLYMVALIAQLAFYAVALLGWRSTQAREHAIVRIVYFFVQTNIALAQAMLSFLAGKRMTVWTPTSR